MKTHIKLFSCYSFPRANKPFVNPLTNEDTISKSNFIICQYFESTSICLFRNPLFLIHRKVYTTSMIYTLNPSIHTHAKMENRYEARSSLNYSSKKGGWLSRDPIDFSCKDRTSRDGGDGVRGSRRLVTSSRAFSFRFVWSEHRSAV